MEMSVIRVSGGAHVGQFENISDPPACSRRRLVRGELQLTCARPWGKKSRPLVASGAVYPSRGHPHRCWNSKNPLNLLRGDACTVKRPEPVLNVSWRSPGRVASGVYAGVWFVAL